MQATKQLMKYLKPYLLSVILAPLLMVLEVSMDLMQPRMVERIVDEGIAKLDMAVVTQTGFTMVGLALIGVIGGVGCTVFAMIASQGFAADLRQALFEKVQSFSFGNLDQIETGKLITRLTNDVTQLQEIVQMVLRIMVRVPMLLVGSLIMAIITSPRLAILYVFFMPIIGVGLYFIINRAYPMFTLMQKKLDNLNTVIQENLSGIRVVKAFVRTDHERSRFEGANEDLMTQTITAMRLVVITMPFMTLMLNVGVVGVVWFGGNFVIDGSMQVGQIIAFVNYLTRTLMSLVFMSMLVMRLSRAAASTERVVEVLNSQPMIASNYSGQQFDLKGRVEFDQVTFSYNQNGEQPVLREIDFVAEPGQMVAILGTTGSGKTSLVSLIPRFYDVSSGTIKVDGVDVRELSEADLRACIAVALQETVLFSGTIRENITFGRPEATDEEMIAAAKIAQAHDFISGFPDGYDTQINQRGVNLSGGQKQRIAIARALLVQPAVLILDDSTSAVDVETEAKIQTALNEVNHRSTIFMVAQRISSVLRADKILVLDKGKLAAEGTHHELLESSPIYQEIFNSQLGNGGVTNVAA
ncbi:MAG: ABC transporter ATP-binding protein [Anaerolineales bacterium]|nr:ABC transporter ATP-binding protein [Anaerolineales bacterium]